jgi:hypothetical protein
MKRARWKNLFGSPVATNITRAPKPIPIIHPLDQD